MKLTKSHWVILAVAVVGLVFVVFKMTRPQDNGGAIEAELALSKFYDWNLASGPIAEEARSLTTEHLVDLGSDGRYIYRLAKSVDAKGDTTRVVLKDGIYWTDQVQLIADHVADAWERAAKGMRDDILHPSDDERVWLGKASLKVIGKLELEVTGYGSAEALTKLLRSRYVIPIRKDLLDIPETADQAWLTTIGRYRLAALPPPSLPKNSTLEFVPNPTYYRGVANETVKVALAQLVDAPQ